MNDPDPAFEKKILLDVVEQMGDIEATNRKQSVLKKTILGLGVAGLALAFFMALHGILHAFSIAILAGMSGCALGFWLFLDFAQKQWPVTRKHIDMDSVRKRLEELDT